MKTAIVYFSKHHGNTEKLLNAIAEKHNVTLFNVSENTDFSLDGFDRIGFASGIYYSKFHKSVLKIAQNANLDGKQVFFIYTYGAKKEGYTEAISEAVKSSKAEIIGSFGCFGFNTFGPFKLIGGLAKGHPTDEEIADAVSFYEGL